MPGINTVQKFRRHEKVVAGVDLPGVASGTRGKVLYEAGLTWFRYRVLFDNGVELGSIDGNDLVTVRAWSEREREARLAALRAERGLQGT
jgi:hypothetical protein